MIPIKTEIVVECDVCGRGFEGPGLRRVIFRLGHNIVCADCSRKLTRTFSDAHRVAKCPTGSGHGTTAGGSLRGA